MIGLDGIGVVVVGDTVNGLGGYAEEASGTEEFAHNVGFGGESGGLVLDGSVVVVGFVGEIELLPLGHEHGITHLILILLALAL